MDEFERIKAYFAPLTGGKDKAAFGNALDLLDDAALLAPPADEEIVITKDMVVEGVHFLPKTPPDLVARKALRMNLSDLAAKGAVPAGYLLACAWPKSWTDAHIKLFADGLKKDQEEFNVTLLGGDTVSIDGPMVCSITCLGTVHHGGMIKRASAHPGDDVYVTGTIGDAYLGLKLLKQNKPMQDRDANEKYLIGRYLLPKPRTALNPSLRKRASAAIDISDGLIADAGHIATASRQGITIEASKIPISKQAAAHARNKLSLFTGGDDYELLFAAPKLSADALTELAERHRIRLTRIGTVTDGTGVTLLDNHGDPIEVKKSGYKHI